MPPNGDVPLTCLESSCLQISSQNGLNYDSWLLCLHPSSFKNRTKTHFFFRGLRKWLLQVLTLKNPLGQQGGPPFSSRPEVTSPSRKRRVPGDTGDTSSPPVCEGKWTERLVENTCFLFNIHVCLMQPPTETNHHPFFPPKCGLHLS